MAIITLQSVEDSKTVVSEAYDKEKNTENAIIVVSVVGGVMLVTIIALASYIGVSRSKLKKKKKQLAETESPTMPPSVPPAATGVSQVPIGVAVGIGASPVSC